jgi:hypothetical protein
MMQIDVSWAECDEATRAGIAEGAKPEQYVDAIARHRRDIAPQSASGARHP